MFQLLEPFVYRYGMNGHPFESDMFDMEIPKAVKEIIPGNQSVYNTPISGGTSSSSSSTLGGTPAACSSQPSDDLDFYEFFYTSSEKSTKSLVEYARNHILGMLEVEPLHFTCHSTSDGTKMERLDHVGSTSNASVINPFGGPTTTTGTMSGTINFGESVPSGSQTAFNSTHLTSLPYSLPQNMAATKQIQDTKNYQSVKYKIMHIKQMLHEVNKNILPSGQQPAAVRSGSSDLMPSTPKTTPQVMTPPLTPPNEAWQQVNIFNPLL